MRINLDKFVNNKCEWLRGEGPKSNIVVSTRVRVARNLDGHVFFNWADEKQKEKVLDVVKKAIKRSQFLKNMIFIDMKDTTELDRQFLIERHLMSHDHAQDVTYKGLTFDDKEIVSIMINEEDHIRLQVMQSGFNLMEAWRIVDDIDTDLSHYLTFSYSNKYGYLTSCPTNTGTGLRASVMLHLAALVITDQIENVYKAISKLGLTMRGFFGEGTEAFGDFFQISNQVALGHSEMDIIDNLEKVINKIIEKEEVTRDMLKVKKNGEMADRISRSYGTLKSAKIITSRETIRLLSDVRLGIDLGFITDINMKTINDILLLMQPAHLQEINHSPIGPRERDIKRADLIKEKLNT